jgi:hypothetical protein
VRTPFASPRRIALYASSVLAAAAVTPFVARLPTRERKASAPA